MSPWRRPPRPPAKAAATVARFALPRMTALYVIMTRFSKPLFRQFGELPQRLEMRLAHRWIEQRPRFRHLQIWRGGRDLLPVVGIGLRRLRRNRRPPPPWRSGASVSTRPRTAPRARSRSRRPSPTLGSERSGKFSPSSRHSLPTASTVKRDDFPVARRDRGVQHARRIARFRRARPAPSCGSRAPWRRRPRRDRRPDRRARASLKPRSKWRSK